MVFIMFLIVDLFFMNGYGKIDKNILFVKMVECFCLLELFDYFIFLIIRGVW